MKKINVLLNDSSYQVIIGSGILPTLNILLHKYNLNRNILFIIDEKVMKQHERRIVNEFHSHNGKLIYYILKQGEKSKSYRELNKIYSCLLENNYGRDSLIIAVGGGVTGDLAGYAAATYMRGIQLVHVPTTLLSMVDSSIGGKTGINFENNKNMIGAFYQPKLVLVDTDFLKTLPKREFTSGLGEVIKYSYMADEKFFLYVMNNLHKAYKDDNKVLEQFIYNCAAIKSAVVSQDEKESGLRKILNLGHTFAHSFETNLKFKIKHGEAVIAGVISALYLSQKICLISEKELNYFLTLPLKIKLPTLIKKPDIEDIFNIMVHDKKNRGGKIKFVLVSGLGKIILDAEADKKSVTYAINMMKQVINK
ncbi:MAG: 3-dehydroquinate synthase [Ignavibacteriaceae bacterium]